MITAVNRGQLSADNKKCKGYNFVLFLFLLSAIQYSVFTADSFAEDSFTVITSDSLEYFSETKKYIAKGSVKIEKDDAAVNCDEMTYFEETADVIAEGNVHYDDIDSKVTASKAEMNMDTKSGKLFDAEVFLVKDNYHLSGKEIEKKGEKYYYSPEAAFTTCDAPVPAWCFKGKDVDAEVGGSLKAKHVFFHIKDVPVFYTPYMWAPLVSERQTGFLTPTISQSSSKGTGVEIPFYWAISENRDATFVFDRYDKGVTGIGLEYRYIEPEHIKSFWWAYNASDSRSNNDFWELRAFHEHRYEGNLGGFLNINFVNEKNFFTELSPHLEIRIQRFLESTGEVNLSFENSRLFLLSQYWIDLKNDNGDVPQRLPEIGYVSNYKKAGAFMFSSSAVASNIHRDNGVSALRLDVYPKILYSFGKDFAVSQSAGLRGTEYFFYKNEGLTDDNVHRLAFEYNVIGHTRLLRQYSSFVHVIEPSIGYHFITSTENNLPVSDSTELFSKTSRIELGVLNRIMIKAKETVTFRVMQGVDTYSEDHPFLPLLIEAGIKKPLNIKMDATYDYYTERVETISSDVSFQVLRANVSVGQRYNRKEDIMLYKTHIVFDPIKSLQLAGTLWYDAKGKGVENIVMSALIRKQCWAVKLEYIKRPDDYITRFMFELTGLFSNIPKR